MISELHGNSGCESQRTTADDESAGENPFESHPLPDAQRHWAAPPDCSADGSPVRGYGAPAVYCTSTARAAARSAASAGVPRFPPVVGYTTTELQTGSKATGASFVTIGETGCKLTSITPTGFDKTTGGVAIQILDNFGMTTKTYKYYKGGRGTYATEGWYDGVTRITDENDVVFAPGTGLWMDGADGYSFQTSGQVLFDDVVCNLRTGSIMLSNPYPMALKLTNITPAGFDKTTGGVAIQILDNFGMTTKTYKYYKGGRGSYATEGWYDGTTRITPESDVAFEPGAGLWVDGSDGYTLTFSLGAID